jgi:uncharacterized membrane protein
VIILLLGLEHLFPATIHPMVVHFTIAIVYMAGFAGVMSLFFRKGDFFVKFFLIMLVFSMLATIAAGAAGVISESYISDYPSVVHQKLHDHKQYGVFTGVFVFIALLLQLWKSYKTRGKMLSSWFAVIATLIAVIFVSMAGHLGGLLVYHFGFGVK